MPTCAYTADCGSHQLLEFLFRKKLRPVKGYAFNAHYLLTYVGLKIIKSHTNNVGEKLTRAFIH